MNNAAEANNKQLSQYIKVLEIELCTRAVEYTNNYDAGQPYKDACKRLCNLAGAAYVMYWVENGEWDDALIVFSK